MCQYWYVNCGKSPFVLFVNRWHKCHRLPPFCSSFMIWCLQWKNMDSTRKFGYNQMKSTLFFKHGTRTHTNLYDYFFCYEGIRSVQWQNMDSTRKFGLNQIKSAQFFKPATLQPILTLMPTLSTDTSARRRGRSCCGWRRRGPPTSSTPSYGSGWDHSLIVYSRVTPWRQRGLRDTATTDTIAIKNRQAASLICQKSVWSIESSVRFDRSTGILLALV